jgi:hypothetical protein
MPGKIKSESQVMFGDASLIEQPRLGVSTKPMQEDDNRAELAPLYASKLPPQWKLEK